MRLEISLANKCLLLFGGAIVLIVLAALSAPWLRMNALVDAGQLELSRQMVASWLRLEEAAAEGADLPSAEPVEHAGVFAQRLSLDRARALGASDPFLAGAIRLFEREPARLDAQASRWVRTTREYLYARAVRSAADPARVLESVVVLERRSIQAARLLLINTTYLLSAGTVVLGLALLVFYQITHRLILSPVRELKDTAERVRGGDIATRSDIATGDEFQELSETFNSMLGNLQANQDQLRAINNALDLKLNELAEANTALFEAAKLKGEFLANISHELRTPLNSIIGFAELLLEIARGEPTPPEAAPVLARRVRYLDNIVAAGRSLLEMINSLLEMAKLEAGRVEVRAEKMSLHDVCEGLLGLIYPLAARKGITLRLEVADDLPMIETDVKKFQQIVFNFLSNAVKFIEAPERSGRPGHVTLRAERLAAPRDPGPPPAPDRVRVSVIDNGPGIAPEQQARIFEKFHQLDSGLNREHAGTGLGLAICKELASLLQAEIHLVSDAGAGSIFSLVLPLTFDPERADEARLEARFRGTLSARRAWG